MIYHGARSHKGSRNSRSRKKSAHNQGRTPEYKELRRNAVDEDGKVCTKCGAFKPYGEFYKYDLADRYHAKCKTCTREDNKAQKQKRTSLHDRLIDAYRAERVRPYEPVPLELLLSRKMYWSKRDWSLQDQGDLKALCIAGIPTDKAADILGRSPYALAYRAQTLRLPLPPEWKKLLAPKTVYIRKPPKFILKYPYLAKATPSDAELLRVNALVPHSFPDWVRADICQSVLLAFYEGEVSIAELESKQTDLRWFYKKYYREQSPHQEIQLSVNADDDRSYDERAAAMAEMRSNFNAQGARWIAPTQEDDVFRSEVGVAKFVYRADHLSSAEAADKLTSGEIKVRDLDMNTFRHGSFGVRLQAQDRLFERWGVEINDERATAILKYCRGRKPDHTDTAAEIHYFNSRKGRIPFVYDRVAHEIISVLPDGGA